MHVDIDGQRIHFCLDEQDFFHTKATASLHEALHVVSGFALGRQPLRVVVAPLLGSECWFGRVDWKEAGPTPLSVVACALAPELLASECGPPSGQDLTSMLVRGVRGPTITEARAYLSEHADRLVSEARQLAGLWLIDDMIVSHNFAVCELWNGEPWHHATLIRSGDRWHAIGGFVISDEGPGQPA